MQELPAYSLATLSAVACDPMPDDADSAQLFDIQMEHISGPGMLIPLNRWNRIQCFEATQTQPRHNPANGRLRHSRRIGNPLTRPALPPQTFDLPFRFTRRPAWRSVRPRRPVQQESVRTQVTAEGDIIAIGYPEVADRRS